MKIQIVPGTLLHTNNYVIGDDENVIVIEASANIRDIKAIVAGRKVHAIFLTHGHWDHSQNIDDFCHELKAKVYLHKDAFYKITSQQPLFRHDKPVKANLKETDCIFVEDEKIYDYGFIKLKVLFTPGHTNCSISIFAESLNAIFSGDTLFYQTYGRCDLPTSSAFAMKESLEKLFNLNGNLDVYPGHGYKTKIEKEINLLEDFN